MPGYCCTVTPAVVYFLMPTEISYLYRQPLMPATGTAAGSSRSVLKGLGKWVAPTARKADTLTRLPPIK